MAICSWSVELARPGQDLLRTGVASLGVEVLSEGDHHTGVLGDSSQRVSSITK